MMLSVQLTQEDWQRVMASMAYAPWKDVNHLLMNMGEQLQKEIIGPTSATINKQTNSKEMPINQGEIGVKQ